METLCLAGLPEVAGGIAVTVVAVASALANILGKDSVLGKIVNFAAINFTVEKKTT